VNDAARLSFIREQLAAIDGEWLLASAGDRLFIEATGPMGELSEVATFHADASTEEMQFAASALQHVRFLIGLVDRAIEAARCNRKPGPEPERQLKDYAAEAAMKCAEPAFKKFLMERHGLESPASDERTAQKLRSVLGVTSRAELNHDDQAAARWKALRGDFEYWRRAG